MARKQKDKVGIEVNSVTASTVVKSFSVPSARKINPIEHEIVRFEKEIKDLQDALNSIHLMEIEDPFTRLKMATDKATLLGKMPKLLEDLRILKLDAPVKADNIRGEQELSPLALGQLDE